MAKLLRYTAGDVACRDQCSNGLSRRGLQPGIDRKVDNYLKALWNVPVVQQLALIGFYLRAETSHPGTVERWHSGSPGLPRKSPI